MEIGTLQGAQTRRALELIPESDLALNSLGTLELLEGKGLEALATFRKSSDDPLRLYGVAMAEHSIRP